MAQDRDKRRAVVSSLRKSFVEERSGYMSFKKIPVFGPTRSPAERIPSHFGVERPEGDVNIQSHLAASYICIYIHTHTILYSTCRLLLTAETCRCKVLTKSLNKAVLDCSLSVHNNNNNNNNNNWIKPRLGCLA